MLGKVVRWRQDKEYCGAHSIAENSQPQCPEGSDTLNPVLKPKRDLCKIRGQLTLLSHASRSPTPPPGDLGDSQAPVSEAMW